MNENGTLTAYEPNPLNQYTSVGGQGLGYDGNFNLTSRPGFDATYNAANQLISANGVEFTYDGLGRCLKRAVNGVSTTFLYDGWKPVIEYDHWGNFVAWNTYGPGRMKFSIAGAPAGAKPIITPTGWAT